MLIELGTILGESHGYGCLGFKFVASFTSAILLNALTKLKNEKIIIFDDLLCHSPPQI